MRIALAALAAAIGLLADPAPALAHGILVGSAPSSNASLDAAPSQAVLVFSEPVAPTISSAEALDTQGRRVSGLPALSGDRQRLSIPLQKLPDGVYTVRWRVLWPADGHTTSGFFAFAVGRPMPGNQTSTDANAPQLARLAVRWIGYLAALLLAGTFLFGAIVLEPALGVLSREDASRIAPASSRRMRLLSVAAAAVLLIASAGEFALLAVELIGTSLPQAILQGSFWPLLLQSKAGWSVLLRATHGALCPTFRRSQGQPTGVFSWSSSPLSSRWPAWVR